MKIAIVGMGIAGGSTLKSLFTKEAVREGDIIHVYEDRAVTGVGLPYQPDDERLILNSFSKDISLTLGNPDEYLEFLEKNYPNQFDKFTFTPRVVFGEYAQELYNPYLEKEEVELIAERVEKIIPLEGEQMKYRLESASGAQEYDAVFLAIGHPPYADYYNLEGHPGYVHEPFPVSNLFDHIDPAKDRVGIVGSSLTALDVMEYLQENAEWKHPITFYTRHEPFATIKETYYEGDDVVYSMDKEWIEANKNEAGKLSFDTAWAQFEKDMEDSKIQLDYVLDNFKTGSLFEVHKQLQEKDEQLLKFQYYIGVISAYMENLVNALEVTGRQQFFENYRPWYEYFHVQLSQVKMEKIWDWFVEGKIRFVRELRDIQPKDGRGLNITTATGLNYETDVLVNATGFETRLHVAAEHDSLIKSLLDADLVMASPQQDVTITWPGSQPISRTYGVVPNLYLSGFWIGSTQYPNNNVQRTAEQGRRMVESFKQNNNR